MLYYICFNFIFLVIFYAVKIKEAILLITSFIKNYACLNILDNPFNIFDAIDLFGLIILFFAYAPTNRTKT